VVRCGPPPSRPAAVMAAAHHVEGPALKLLEGGEPEADKVLHVDGRALGRAPERLAISSVREADLGRRVDEEDVGVLGLSSEGGQRVLGRTIHAGASDAPTTPCGRRALPTRDRRWRAASEAPTKANKSAQGSGKGGR
jgi:hypothetical protein